jgi:hypothetical protein
MKKIFLGIYFLIVIFANPNGTMISNSVLNGAINFVEKGSFQIDILASFDIATSDKNPELIKRRYFSGLMPGATFIAIPYYFIFQKLIPHLPFRLSKKNVYIDVASRPQNKQQAIEQKKIRHKIYYLQIIMVLLFMAPMAAWLFTQLVRFIKFLYPDDPKFSLYFPMSIMLGTFILPYFGVYSRQGISNLLLWNSVLFLLNQKQFKNWHFTLCGVLTALAASCDLWISASSACAGILLYHHFRFNKVQIGYYILGTIFPAALYFSYQQINFGKALSTSYHFRPQFAHYNAESENSLQHTKTLFDPFFVPSLKIIKSLLFSLNKGLFIYSPILLLSIGGIILGINNKLTSKVYIYSSIGVTLLYLLLNSGLRSIQVWGGLTFFWGPRYLVSSIAWYSLGMIIFYKNFPRIFKVVMTVSIFINFLGLMYGYQMINYQHFGMKPTYHIWDFLVQFFTSGPILGLFKI